MKSLKLNMHFKLPDNFTGDLNDALEELLKYRRNQNKSHKDIYEYNSELSQYENFMIMVNTTDRVLLAEGWMGVYDNDKNEWTWNDDNIFLIENKNK